MSRIFPPEAGAGEPAEDITADMTALYDSYFASQDYHRRYPRPNAATLDFLLREGAAGAGRILDYGCGDGRYAVPLLERTQATVACYDISHAAIDALRQRLQGSPFTARAPLLCGRATVLQGQQPFDVALLLFGVLSHVGDHEARVAVLRQVRDLLVPGGRLLLTVPSKFRRRPLELLRAAAARARGRARGSQREEGNVVFTRTIGQAPRRFFYHLYSVRGLRAELAEAGLRLRGVAPESMLPEWMITQSSLLGRLDAAMLPLLPAALGYGIRAVAERVEAP